MGTPKTSCVVEIHLPAAAQLSAPALRDALVATAERIIAEGYEPAALARALVATGAMLALDLAGRDFALGQLRDIADQVAVKGSPHLGETAVAGRA